MRPLKDRASVDLNAARDVAVKAVEAAGAVVRSASFPELGVRRKADHGDVVTDLDQRSERLIVGQLGRAFPEHRIVAEESGLQGADGGNRTWLVDPLDGTNNLVIGLSAYAVGVALAVDDRPVLGAVHDPIAQHTWSAVRDRGARGPRLLGPHSPYQPGPRRSVLAWTQGYAVGQHDDRGRALCHALESGSRRVLQLWAPLLCWLMLARRDIDGFVGYRPEAIDLPAGYLIARETGVQVRGLDGSPFDDRIDRSAGERSFVAARPEAMPDLLAMVRAAEGIAITP